MWIWMLSDGIRWTEDMMPDVTVSSYRGNLAVVTGHSNGMDKKPVSVARIEKSLC